VSASIALVVKMAVAKLRYKSPGTAEKSRFKQDKTFSEHQTDKYLSDTLRNKNAFKKGDYIKLRGFSP
jgi:hypothetical protein